MVDLHKKGVFMFNELPEEAKAVITKYLNNNDFINAKKVYDSYCEK